MAYKTLYNQPVPQSSLSLWFLLLSPSLHFSHTGLLVLPTHQTCLRAFALVSLLAWNVPWWLPPLCLLSLLRCHLLNEAYPDNSILSCNEPTPPTRNFLPLHSSIFSTASHLLACYMIYLLCLLFVFPALPPQYVNSMQTGIFALSPDISQEPGTVPGTWQAFNKYLLAEKNKAKLNFLWFAA